MRVGCHLSVGEALQRALIVVFCLRQAHPRQPRRPLEPALLRALLPHERRVDLHERAEWFALRAHQSRAQLVQPTPRRPVGAEAQDALQIHRRDARAARADLEYRPEPHLQRFARLLKHRARRQARLVTTVRTFEQDAIALGPHAGALAASAGRLATPSRLDPVRSAVLLRRETLLEFYRRLGKISPQIVMGMLHHGPNSLLRLMLHANPPELSA